MTSLGSLGSTALASKLYVRLGSEPEALQPEPRAGKLYEATPDSLSLVLALRSKEPAAPERK